MYVFLWTYTEMHFCRGIWLKPRFEMPCSGVSLHSKTNALKGDIYIRWQPSLSHKRSQDHNIWCLQKFPDYYRKPRPKNTAEWDVTDITEEGNFCICKCCVLAGWKHWKARRAKLQSVFKLKSTFIFKHVCSSLELVQCTDLQRENSFLLCWHVLMSGGA